MRPSFIIGALALASVGGALPTASRGQGSDMSSSGGPPVGAPMGGAGMGGAPQGSPPAGMGGAGVGGAPQGGPPTGMGGASHGGPPSGDSKEFGKGKRAINNANSTVPFTSHPSGTLSIPHGRPSNMPTGAGKEMQGFPTNLPNDHGLINKGGFWTGAAPAEGNVKRDEESQPVATTVDDLVTTLKSMVKHPKRDGEDQPTDTTVEDLLEMLQTIKSHPKRDETSQLAASIEELLQNLKKHPKRDEKGELKATVDDLLKALNVMTKHPKREAKYQSNATTVHYLLAMLETMKKHPKRDEKGELSSTSTLDDLIKGLRVITKYHPKRDGKDGKGELAYSIDDLKKADGLLAMLETIKKHPKRDETGELTPAKLDDVIKGLRVITKYHPKRSAKDNATKYKPSELAHDLSDLLDKFWANTKKRSVDERAAAESPATRTTHLPFPSGTNAAENQAAA